MASPGGLWNLMSTMREPYMWSLTTKGLCIRAWATWAHGCVGAWTHRRMKVNKPPQKLASTGSEPVFSTLISQGEAV